MDTDLHRLNAKQQNNRHRASLPPYTTTTPAPAKSATSLTYPTKASTSGTKTLSEHLGAHAAQQCWTTTTKYAPPSSTRDINIFDIACHQPHTPNQYTHTATCTTTTCPSSAKTVYIMRHNARSLRTPSHSTDHPRTSPPPQHSKTTSKLWKSLTTSDSSNTVATKPVEDDDHSNATTATSDTTALTTTTWPQARLIAHGSTGTSPATTTH
jgi:hypothetical protein